MHYPGQWGPGSITGGPWTVPADSDGSADGGNGTSGLDLNAGGSGHELITAGQSMADLDLGVLATFNAAGSGTDSIEVLWHVSAPDTYWEFTVGDTGWQVVQVVSGVANPVASGPDAATVGAVAAIQIAVSGGSTTVTLNGNQVASGLADPTTGDIGVAAANGGDATVLAVALST
jgi:hypothetical protein